MTPDQRNRLLSALHDIDNIDAALAAAAELQSVASDEDVPWLIEVLGDHSFFVREAAAWPLSDLGRVDTLPQLLAAYELGLSEGHDNDGFSAALIDLVSANPQSASLKLQQMAPSASGPLSDRIKWLQEFCD